MNAGTLPSGRYKASLEELAQRFGAETETRRELWEEWTTATDMLRRTIPVCAAWIGGSYLTDKDHPDDIDCVYIVDADLSEAASDSTKRLLQAFASGNVLRNTTGLRVETYVLDWVSSSTPRRGNPEVRGYHQLRGYWDDLWSKKRSSTKGAVPNRLDSHPRRGYVEVILDGYSEAGHFRID